jgi:hypothetical protein
VQFEDYTTCDSALKRCAVHIIDQVLDQQLIRPEELEQAELEVAEDEVTFLNTLKGLQAARKNKCQFAVEDNITVICKKVENELHKLKKKKNNALI